MLNPELDLFDEEPPPVSEPAEHEGFHWEWHLTAHEVRELAAGIVPVRVHQRAQESAKVWGLAPLEE